MDDFICFNCLKFNICLVENVVKGKEPKECKYIEKSKNLSGDGTLCDDAEDIIGIRPLNLRNDHDRWTYEKEVKNLALYHEFVNDDYKDVLNSICETKDAIKLEAYNGLRDMEAKSIRDKRNKLILSGLFFDIDIESISHIMGIPLSTVYYLLDRMKK